MKFIFLLFTCYFKNGCLIPDIDNNTAYVEGTNVNVLTSVVAVQSYKFPPCFKFGAATSAYQIEGSWNTSDKSPSIWDHFIHSKPERIQDLSSADIACDSYNNWQRDVEMAEELGLHFYRFSLSWSRLMPLGYPHKISKAGKDYYNNLINALLAKKIEPIVTMYHWDLPQSLQNLGGWANPQSIEWFNDYARAVFSLFADRVKTWITFNEPVAFCDFSFNSGIHAPGIVIPGIGSYICNKNVLMAHAKTWRMYDKEFRPKYQGKVSIANFLTWMEAEKEQEEETAELARQLVLGMYTYPIFSKEGGWPPLVENHIKEKSKMEGWSKSRLPDFTQKEKEFVKGTYDFFGFNYYTSRTVRKAKPGEAGGTWPMEGNYDFDIVFSVRPEWKIGATWFYIYPEGLRYMLKWLKEKFGDLEFFITENGYADIDPDLFDVKRVSYYMDHLEQVLLSINEDNINVTGYTAWTLMDNFEWAFGYKLKFGLYHVDFEDPKRTRRPRASAEFYKRVIKQHLRSNRRHRHSHLYRSHCL